MRPWKAISAGYHSQSIGVLTVRLSARKAGSVRPSCRLRHDAKAVIRSSGSDISRDPKCQKLRATRMSRCEAVGFGVALVFVCVLSAGFACGMAVMLKLIAQLRPVLMPPADQLGLAPGKMFW